MDTATKQQLAVLTRTQRAASLGTLRTGGPLVSLVMYAEEPGRGTFLIHVSRLAQHTQDILADPRVGLMIAEPDEKSRNPQALARLSLQGEAVAIEPESDEFASAAQCYLTKLPQNTMMFGLGDFILYRIVPHSARFVAGFGRIFNLGINDLREATQPSDDDDDSDPE